MISGERGGNSDKAHFKEISKWIGGAVYSLAEYQMSRNIEILLFLKYL